jgi:hypothetical protein
MPAFRQADFLAIDALTDPLGQLVSPLVERPGDGGAITAKVQATATTTTLNERPRMRLGTKFSPACPRTCADRLVHLSTLCGLSQDGHVPSKWCARLRAPSSPELYAAYTGDGRVETTAMNSVLFTSPPSRTDGHRECPATAPEGQHAMWKRNPKKNARTANAVQTNDA